MNGPSRIVVKSLLVSLFLVASFLPLSAHCAGAGAHSVLVLHSYHKADWTDELLNGIQSVLGPRGDVELRVEYMDTKTLYTPQYLSQLADIYSAKYTPEAFDLVLTTDDNALQFALDQRERLFPGVPVVFCGVNRVDSAIWKNYPAVTGVVEKGDFEATLRLAGQLLPQSKRVYVLCDRTPTGQINLEGFRRELALTLPDHEMVLLQDVSFVELRESLSTVPKRDDFAFFISFWKDREGRVVEPGDLERVFRAATVPIFGRSEWMVGRGLTGGMCVHGVSQGQAAARLAARILDGEPPSAVPVVTDSPNKYLFDYQELTRHGLDPDLLPADHILFNAPRPFYALDKGLAVVLAVSSAFGLVLIVVLTGAVRRQHRAERDLRRSEQLYRTLVDNVDLGITLVDQDYRVVMTNAAQCRLFGKPAGYFAGRACFREFQRRDEACPHCPGREAMESGVAQVVETQGVLESGDRFDARVRAFPVLTEGAQTAGFIEVVEDISAEKRAEAERRQFEEQLRETQKLESLGVLAGGIAHDFNNLLMGILGNADLALLKMPPESPARDYVKRTAVAAEHAADLANQMLAYSGKGRFVVERLNLNVLVEEMTHLLQTVINKKAQLRVQQATELPLVEADPTQLRQVVMNLITNASDALQEGNGTISLHAGTMEVDRDYPAHMPGVTDLQPGRYAFIEVGDTGCGMDDPTRERMFDPFYTTKDTGRGLGLAAVQGIVRGHGGAIRVYSEPGRGTTIKVLFPAAEAAPDEELPAKPSPAPGGGAAPGGLVLVVDDDPSVREVATHMLGAAGYRVIVARDGQEAVDTYRERQAEVCLVLLDMTMPRKSGEEAYREMRAIRPDVNVILSSGYNEQEAVRKFSGKGLAGFIQKPYRAKQLLEIVGRVCGQGA